MPFLDKLRMNNLYPTVPIGDAGGDHTFDTFMNQIAPLYNQNRLPQIYSPPHPQGPQPNGYNGTGPNPLMGDGRPGNLTRMDTVYRQPPTDIHPAEMVGVETNPASSYQKGELANKQRELDIKQRDIEADNALNKQKVGVSQQRADVYKFKAENPGMKFQMNKASGNLEAIDPISGRVTNLGHYQMPEDELIALNQSNDIAKQNNQAANASNLEGQRQTGRETLTDMQARHQQELAALNSTMKPTGTTREVEVTRDKNGNVTGARTKTTEDNTNTITMYGRDGKPYKIPANKVSSAFADGFSSTKPMTPAKAH